MKKKNEPKQKESKDNYYLIILAVSLLPLFLIKDKNEDSSFLFYLSVLLLGVNLSLFLYTRSRLFSKPAGSFKIRLLTLFSLSASLWLFLHCLFRAAPSLNNTVFLMINRLSNSLSDLYSFKSGAVSFLTANFVLLVISLTELFIHWKKIEPFYRYIYMGAAVLCFFTAFSYTVLFPDIVTSKPKVRLLRNEEALFVNPAQKWDMFYNGKKVDIYSDTISYKWYYNDKFRGSGTTCETPLLGNYRAVMTTVYGDIKSEVVSVTIPNK